MNGVVRHGQGIDGDGVLQGEKRKFMIVDGGSRDGKIVDEGIIGRWFLLNGSDLDALGELAQNRGLLA